jgi:serine/threonine-protein kinase
MHDVCYHDPPAPSTFDAHRRWPQYDTVVARAMEKQPGARYPNAAAFRAAIVAEYAEPLNSTLSDATITPVKRGAARADGGPPSRPPDPTGAGLQAAAGTPVADLTSSPPPTGWSAPVLAGIEIELARFVGPIARVLVRRAAQTHKDVHTLTAALLSSIEHRENQDAFVRAVTGAGIAALRTGAGGAIDAAGASAAPAPVGAGTDSPLTPVELEHATRVLTQYIGPIARVVTKRAAAAGVGRTEFLRQVAQTLDSDAKRERFLREATIPGV